MALKYSNEDKTAASFNGAFFTLSAPEDWDSIGDGPTRDAVKAWLAAGNVPEPMGEPSTEQRIVAIVAVVQKELDRRAQERGYDNIVSACSYAAQPAGAPFQAEGAAFLQWRSAVWAKAYATLADVQAGKVPMPSAEQAVADMPEIVWPS